MSNVKISNLPQIDGTATTKNTIVATVDSGSTTTSKITLGDLMKNGSLIDDFSTNYYNSFLSAGGPSNGATVGAEFRGSTSESVILAGNGYIDAGTNNVLMGCLEAAGGNSTYISGGANQCFISSSFRGYIQGGERNAAIASSDFAIQNAYNGVILGNNGGTVQNGPSLLAGSQGCTIQSNRAVVIASEAMTLNSNMSAVIASYGGTVNGNLYQVSAGCFQPTFTNPGGYENMLQLGTRETTIQHQRSTMVSTSGRTSLYSGTTHVDNIHTFQTETFTETNGGNVGGAITVDCSQSTFYFFTMTADTSVNFTNVKDGQRFMFIVYNSGTYAVTGATVNGVSSTVYAKNGTINPTNNGYSKYVATYDSVNGFLFLDEELAFSAV